MQQTYRILVENLPKLTKLIEKQNRKAAKLGLAPIVVTSGPWETVTAEDGITVDVFVPVTIDGQSPHIGNFIFVATLQHTEDGNIIRTVPTHEAKLPEEFRTSDPGRCDHCHQYRRRNDTFVIAERYEVGYGIGKNEYKQVGRNCLADFVGSDKVHSVAALAEMMSLISEACEGYGERLGGGGSDMLDLDGSIRYAAEAMLRFGWVSRSKAEEWGKEATADLALGAMENARKGRVCTWKCPNPCAEHFTPSERAIEFTQAALEWAPGWIERELDRSESDYIWNLKVVLANDVIPLRSFGLAASVLGAYQRDLEHQLKIERERANSTSEWQGEVGGKLYNLTLTVKAVRYIDTDYGCKTLYTFEDESGNLYKWFSSSGELG